MPATAPRDSVIATVGDGFGSLLVHTTARYLGFENEQMSVFGPSENPVGTYQQFAYNLGQTVLRSESESHFLAPDWPTFAQLDAWSHKSLKPLWRTTRRKYNPGVPEILTEAAVVTRRTGWEQARVPVKVGWLQRQMEPMPHFVMYDEQANFIGRAKHVMLAPGHGPLSFPPLLAKARKDPALADRIVQAYEPKQYASGGRYIVLGAGIASVNEWANILDAGGSVLALTRSPQPETQDLNVPRCLFESIGIDAYTRLPFDQRIEFLGQVLRGTRPDRKQWLARIQAGQKEGRFDAIVGEIDKIEPGRAGLRVYVKSMHGEDPGWLDVTGVTAGTGLQQVGADASADPPARRVLQGAGRRRAAQAADQLRRARARPARVAVVLHGTDRQQRDPARRHDRRPEVHRAAVRRRLRARREAEEASVPVAYGAAVLDGQRRGSGAPDRGPDRAARVEGRSPCVQPSSAGSRPDGRS